MELDSVQRRPLHGTGEALAVRRGAEQIALGRRTRREGVDEVERRLFAQPFREQGGVLPAHWRPADVRDLVAVGLQWGDDSVEQREPARPLVLDRGLEEQLEAQADA